MFTTNFVVCISTDDKENISQQSQEGTSSSQSSSQRSRKRPRTDARVELQNNIAAAPRRELGKLFRMCTLIESHGLKWGDVSLEEGPATGNEMLVLKNGGSQILQEQGENQALQSRAVRHYKPFKRARHSEMKTAPFIRRHLYFRLGGGPEESL